MNQSLYGGGGGAQTPAAANDAARPRRIAHEYGHTLGLDDGYADDASGDSVLKDPTKKNDIMSETWPDASGKLPHPHPDQYDQVLKSRGW
jgi:bacillopeptidase F (M6 metalloprotease family)